MNKNNSYEHKAPFITTSPSHRAPTNKRMVTKIYPMLLFCMLFLLITVLLSGCKKHDITPSFQYTVDNTRKTATITGYTGDATEIEVPRKIQEYEITTIASSAFAGRSDLKSIIIPDSVTSIEAAAFSGCSSIESITIPFLGANKFAKSASDSTLFGYIFGTLDYAGAVAINQSYSKNDSITYYLPSSLTSVTVTGGEVFYGAFNNCYILTNVTIGDLVTAFGPYALSGCTGITHITVPFVGERENSSENTHFGYIFGAPDHLSQNQYIPSTIKSVCITGGSKIEGYSFYNCNHLTSITLPDSITSINYNTFNGCDQLIVTENGIHYVDTWVIGCDSDVSVANLRASAKGIADHAFQAKNNLTSVTIGNSLVTIGSHAFYDCFNLTSVTMGDSVKSIGDFAFRSCMRLTSVIFGKSVSSIGMHAFYHCANLATVDIPDSVTSIGNGAFTGCEQLITEEDGIFYVDDWLIDCDYPVSVVNLRANTKGIADGAFSGCPKITSITVAEGSTVYKSIDGNLYTADEKTLVRYASNRADAHFAVPDSVTMIADDAFYQCSNIVTITIPDSLTSIGNYAFYDCSELTHVLIPDSVNLIGDYAFKECSYLASVTLSNSVRSIGEGAFDGCFGLTIYSEAETQPESWSDTWNSSNCPVVWGVDGFFVSPNENAAGVSYYFSDASMTATVIGYVGDLRELKIPEKVKGYMVTKIGARAFRRCKGLTSVTVSDSILEIGEWAFSTCYYLTSINLGNSVTSIGDGAFATCNAFASITIPDSVTSIGNEAFSGCSGLISITIPDSVTSIGYKAFYACFKLTGIIIPKSVKLLGSSVFNDCENLTIYCEAESQPDGWDADWNMNHPVIWGYKES